MPLRPARSARSYLYVPGDRPHLFGKCVTYGADAIILDLEDAVLPAAKAAALAAVEAHLQDEAGSAQWWVRIDSTQVEQHILRLGRLPRLSGLMVPKATAASIAVVDRILASVELERGVPSGTIRVIALIESARGVLDLSDIARHPRVLRFAIGEADLTGELGIEPSADRTELWPIRLQVVIASAAAGLSSPIAPAYLLLHDTDGVQRSTVELRKLGFRARTALHPHQIPHINQAFSPSEEEVEKARNILQLFSHAVGQGTGVLTDQDGRFIDEAVARAARSVLELDEFNSSR